MNSAQKRRERRGLVKLEHEVWIHEHKQPDAERWCREQFGKRWNVIDQRDGRWACFWAGANSHWLYRFCFAQEADAMMFALKWV